MLVDQQEEGLCGVQLQPTPGGQDEGEVNEREGREEEIGGNSSVSSESLTMVLTVFWLFLCF